MSVGAGYSGAFAIGLPGQKEFDYELEKAAFPHSLQYRLKMGFFGHESASTDRSGYDAYALWQVQGDGYLQPSGALPGVVPCQRLSGREARDAAEHDV